MKSSAQPSDGLAPSEHRWTARVGGALFRKRSWLPVPLVLLTLLAPSHPSVAAWITGAALIGIGEAVRLAGVAAAGPVTRRRSRNVQRLVTYGIFAWVRNPLYVGNFFIWLGFVAISGALVVLPIAIVLFALEYALIVAYEEGVLASIFGAEYLTYRARTPRWFPRPPRIAETGPHDWREAWRSEVSTFMQYVALVAVFALRQRYWPR